MGGTYDESEVALIATIAWAIWGNRNEVRNGGKKKSGCELVQWTSRYLKEYYATLERPATDLEVQVMRWSPPPPDRYKINVVGAVFKAQKAAGVGVLIRDCRGQVIAALSKKINAPLRPVEFEAKAVEAGVQFVREIGIQDFIIEGDSLTVFNALCGNTSPPSSVATVVSGIKVLSGYSSRVNFHVHRQCNRPAHLLAKYAVGIVDFVAWLEENSCFIEQYLHHDVSCLN
ncbi:uncharacterized protein LOC142616482 [Castanea sativa]|uniref:uncharacterized protein LOC142616482 n=1 Tax=Castanea sativa TaxID=21020 RepID=UPI003F65021B